MPSIQNSMHKSISSFGLLLLALLPLLSAQAMANVDRIVAIVNNDVILASELKTRKERILRDLQERGAQMPPDKVISEQILERLIQQRLQLQLAGQTGIRTSEEALDQTIANIAKRNNMNVAEFRDALLADGVQFAAFREEVRDEMTLGQLRQRDVLNEIQVSDREVDNFLNAQEISGNQEKKYRLGHILIAFNEQDEAQKTKAREKADRVQSFLANGDDFSSIASRFSDGQNAAEGGDLGWRRMNELPTFLTQAASRLKIGETSENLETEGGFHIIKLIDSEGLQRHLIRQTRVQHILIKTSEIVSDQDALARLRQLATRLHGGENFSDLARSHSDDSMSTIKGGELGWIAPGQSDENFEEAMDALQPGEMSDPVRSPFGWHLIQVLERRTLDDTEEHQRALAREKIRTRKADEQIKNWLQRIRDEAYVEIRL